MSDPPILFVKPQAISARDKRALKTAGVIIVEIDDPQSVKFVRAHAEIEGTTLLAIAAKAIAETKGYENVREVFGRALSAHLALMNQMGTKTNG